MSARDLADALARRVEIVLREGSAVDSGVKVIADTLAVASAAPRLDSRSLFTANLLSSRSGGVHSILGLGLRAGLLEAVAANSYMAHALELDDWLPAGYVHAGAVVVPAALAASEVSGVSVEALARAVAAGYEVAGFIGAMLGRSYYSRWHTTATAGAAGAAAAFTLAYGLGVEESLEAAALALNYMGGLWEAARSGGVKPFSAMHAATLGVKAALSTIASGGASLVKVLEAVCGTYGCSGPQRVPEPPLVGHSRLKFYSACYHSHSAIRAAEILAGRLGGREPTRIIVKTYREAVEIAGIEGPKSAEEARFSIPFLVALTLLGRKPLPGAIREGLSDERVLSLARKVVVEVDPNLDALYPHLMPAVLEVDVGGDRLTLRVDMPPGTLVLEVSKGRIMDKAASLAEDSGSDAPAALAGAFLNARLSDAANVVLNTALAR